MDYKVLLNGKDINADIKAVEINDRQGAKADDIRLIILNDINVSVDTGDTLECVFGGFKTGKMNIDMLSSNPKTSTISAISAPLYSKEKKTRHWRKVRFFEIVNDMAKNCGLSVFYQGIENYYYENVTQFYETDLAFLNRLCVREGYSLKIDNNRLIIYKNALVESAQAVKTIGSKDILFERIAFSKNPNKIKSVTVKYFADKLISYTASANDAYGVGITINEYVADIEEAKRFSKNYLENFTQNDVTVDLLTHLNDGISAGNVIEIEDYARFNGRYLVSECCYDTDNEQMRICGRKIK